MLGLFYLIELDLVVSVSHVPYPNSCTSPHSSIQYLVFALVLLFSIMASDSASAGKLYSKLEHEHFGELWTHSVMIYRTEVDNHHQRVEEINTMAISDGKKQELLDIEYARHDALAENFRRTRGMIQGAVINETNARLGQNIDGAVTPSLGKRPGDKGFRQDQADWDGQSSELAAKRLKEVIRDMGLDRSIDINTRDTAGVLELGDNFELTINKTGVAAKPGSEFHQVQNAIDARHPETFLSQKLLHKKQAGRQYIEIQDHLKKASKGHVLSGDQLIANSTGRENARVMYKSTRKALDTGAIDKDTLTKILRQNDIKMTRKRFHNHLTDIETSKSGRLISKLRDADKVNRIRRASEDIFAAAERKSYTVAEQQKAELQSRIDDLPAGSPKRQALQAELQDTRVKMRESAAANQEYRRAQGYEMDGLVNRGRPDVPRTQTELERAVSGQSELRPQGNPDLPAAAFKAYNDLNDVAQAIQVVEDYKEGRASLGKALLVIGASIADNTVTMGAAGTAVQTGEKIYDHQAAKAHLDTANKRNMEAYMTRFAIEFRRAGMSKEDALRYVDNAERDGNVDRLKKKIEELRAQGHPVKLPKRPLQSIIVAADDTVAQRADQVLLGGGGAKLSDLWDAWDQTDYANRRNLEAHMAQWVVNLRRAGMDEKAAKRLVAESLLANDFSLLKRAANALRAEGKKIDIPKLQVETITADDDVLQRMREFGFTRHTIMVPSRVIDAVAESEKAEAELDYRNARITAQTRTDLFRKLKRAGIESKRALLALNNWEDGEFGLLKKVLGEAHANIEKQRLKEAELAQAEAHKKAALAAMQAEQETIKAILGLVRDLRAMTFTIESDPYPIPTVEGQDTTNATIVITSSHDPQMTLNQIAANIIERYGSAPATRVHYKMHFGGKTVSNDGIWELSLPVEPGMYPLNALVAIEIENSLPQLRPLDRVVLHELAVNLKVVPGEQKHEADADKESLPKTSDSAKVTEVAEPSLAATVPGNWQERRITRKAIVLRRPAVNAPSARKDCAKTSSNGRLEILLNPSSAPDSKAAIDREMNAHMAAKKKENRPVTLDKVQLAGFTGSVARIARRYYKGSASFSGFRSGSAWTHAHGYLINPAGDALMIGYNVGASGCFDNSDRAWIEAQVDAITQEAESIIASVRYIPGGKVTFTPYTPPPQQSSSQGSDQTAEPGKTKEKPKDKIKQNDPEDKAGTDKKTQPKPQKDKASKRPQTTEADRADEELQAPYVRADKRSYVLGQDAEIRARFAFAEPRKGDYVALYKQEAGDKHYETYQYTKAQESGELSFALPEQPGFYQLRLMHTGYTRVHADKPFEIKDGDKQLSPEKWAFLEGEVAKFDVSFKVPVAKSKDWVAIYEVGAKHKSYQNYAYTDDKREGTVSLTLPTKVGAYELRYYQSGYKHVFTAPRQLHVREAPRELNAEKWRFVEGEVAEFDVEFKVPIPKKKDWIAVYEAGAGHKPYRHYAYTDGSAQGRVTLPLPKGAGVYELRYYRTGYKHVFTGSRTVEITEAPRLLKTDRKSYAPGADIRVQWQLPYPKRKDWIAIYKQGNTSRKSYTAYKYTNGQKLGHLTLKAPDKLGIYELRYYPSGGGKRQITSSTFIVQ